MGREGERSGVEEGEGSEMSVRSQMAPPEAKKSWGRASEKTRELEKGVKRASPTIQQRRGRRRFCMHNSARKNTGWPICFGKDLC